MQPQTDSEIEEVISGFSVETCKYEMNNITLTGYTNGSIMVSNGDKEFYIAGNIRKHGISSIDNIVVRGPVGSREIVASQGNHEFILDGDLVFDRLKNIP